MFNIPVFHGAEGEDPGAYLREFNRACRLTNWSVKERTEILPDFLEGSALAWHEALPEETKNDWEKLTKVMKERFGTVESPNALLLQLDQLFQKEGESVSAFSVRYETLFAKYQHAALHVIITSSSSTTMVDSKSSMAMEHLKMSRFVMALVPGLRGKVLSKDPTSFQEALRIALKKEAALQIESTFQTSTTMSSLSPHVEAPSTSQVPSSSSLNHNISQLMAEFADLKLHLVNARPPRPPRVEDRPRDRSGITCYECQEKGHYRNECPKLRKREDKNISLLEGICSEDEEEREVLMAKRDRRTRSQMKEDEVDEEEEIGEDTRRREKT